MSKVVTWVILAVIAVLLVALLATLPGRRAGELTPSPTLQIQIGTPLSTTPFPTLAPSPTPLTPDQTELKDLGTDTEALALEGDGDADLQAIDTELRGL